MDLIPTPSDLVHLPWEPYSPQAVGGLFRSLDGPWWIAGGYALEAFVGQPFRAHEDIDVLVLRRDTANLHTVLEGFELWAADPPGALRRWESSETLPTRVHDIWCRVSGTAIWKLQLMVDEVEGEEWVSRREARVRRPIGRLGWSHDGVRYLAPEVQLFYKAGSPRDKDERDREKVLPLLGGDARAWLQEAVATVYGRESPWFGIV
jgi:hypothetical protein